MPGIKDQNTVEAKMLRSLSDADLQVRLRAYGGISWINTPEHGEMTRRQWVARGNNANDKRRS